jgi:hypothetical protein
MRKPALTLRPELKQAWDLTLADFVEHPVWVCVHGNDQDEWWYEESDEATFRPWTGELPVSPESRNLLVRASIELHDGSRYEGALRPAPLNWAESESVFRLEAETGLIAFQQPVILFGNQQFRFWGGIPGISPADRQAFYAAVGLPSDKVFPLQCVTKPGLADGICEGMVLGFYQLLKKGDAWVGEVRMDPPLSTGPPATFYVDPDPPPMDRSPTSRYGKWIRTALAEAITKLETEPANLRLYQSICLFQFEVQDYEACLAFSNSGLAAESNSEKWDGNRDDLIFLGARALFELGRYQEAIDRARPLSPNHSTLWSDATLMSKKSLVKACKVALKLPKL